MKIRTAAWAADQRNRTVEGFLARPAFDDRAEDAARSVLGEIRSRGDSAVVAYAKEFDGAELRPRDMRVKPAEITEARKAVDPAFRKAAREARRRIAAFAKAGIKQDWQMPSPKGGVLSCWRLCACR